MDVAEYSDDEDEEELLYATIKSPVIGFSEQLDCIFLQEQGVFMISLESGQHQRVREPDQRFYGSVYPYSAFYTPGTYVLLLYTRHMVLVLIMSTRHQHNLYQIVFLISNWIMYWDCTPSVFI